jgi:hypothetical protein
MGNASSNHQPNSNQTAGARRGESPAGSRRNGSPSATGGGAAAAAGRGRTATGSHSSASPSPTTSHRVHPSLRHKKKSLELPDLATLSLSSTSATTTASPGGGSNRRGGGGPAAVRTSSPIPIPMSPHNAGAVATTRPVLPSTSDMTDDLLALQNQNANPSRNAHFRGAPLPYSSTRSFTTAGKQTKQSQQPVQQPSQRTSSQAPRPAPTRPIENAVPAVVPKIISNVHNPLDSGEYTVDGQRRKRPRPEPVPYKVVWRGHATSVVLARAGDDHWRGRQVMEKEYVFIFTLYPYGMLIYLHLVCAAPIEMYGRPPYRSSPERTTSNLSSTNNGRSQTSTTRPSLTTAPSPTTSPYLFRPQSASSPLDARVATRPRRTCHSGPLRMTTLHRLRGTSPRTRGGGRTPSQKHSSTPHRRKSSTSPHKKSTLKLHPITEGTLVGVPGAAAAALQHRISHLRPRSLGSSRS